VQYLTALSMPSENHRLLKRRLNPVPFVCSLK
jgi:hypothetical protein